jgi:hypothetical protein
VRLRDLAFPCTGVGDWPLPNRLRKYAAIFKEEKMLRDVKVVGWVGGWVRGSFFPES